MGLLDSFFSKKAAAAKAEVKRIENRDLMQATVGAMVLVAFADGECAREELERIDKLIAANDKLAHFGQELHATMNRYVELMEAGARLGEIKILREIEDVKDNGDEAEEVLVCAIEIAEAQMPIDEKEMKVLAKIGRTLGLRLSDYGLEA